MINFIKNLFHKHDWQLFKKAAGIFCDYNSAYIFDESCLYKIEKCRKCNKERGFAVMWDKNVKIQPEWIKTNIFKE